MKKLLTTLLAGICLCACFSNNKTYSKPKVKVQPMADYTNEFFSMKYPAHWEYEEEVNNVNDTIPGMSKGIRATFYNPNPYAAWHTVMVQKSVMPELFDNPEQWRDASVQIKQLNDQYIGIVDRYMVDSLTFGSYPAAMAGFVVVPESGDTLIHKQIVVLVNKDLYYLNNTFDWHDNGKLEQLGDSILSTVQFKRR